MDLWELSDLATPWAVHVVATLRVADRLAAGPAEIRPLAAASGADPDCLARVLRHLAAKGLFSEPAPGRFALEPAGRGLLDEGLRSGLDLDSLGGRMANAWGTLLEAVRTGRPAYHRAFGRSFWDDLEAHPHIAADFDRLMGPGHGVPDPQVLADASDWPRIRTVVDVGGGTGTLLAAVLRAQPHVRGTLVDLPRTVARSAAIFEAAGVSDRVTCVGQSFFDPLPSGADLYLLKSVLSDWPDPEAAAILRRCGDAARPNGRVVILNGVTPEQHAEPELLMLVLVGGKGRTLDEFRDLARSSGLTVTATSRQPSGRFVVECKTNPGAT
jgi:SAM-dependent methyltransferase